MISQKQYSVPAKAGNEPPEDLLNTKLSDPELNLSASGLFG
jgi:hypothetical protein